MHVFSLVWTRPNIRVIKLNFKFLGTVMHKKKSIHGHSIKGMGNNVIKGSNNVYFRPQGSGWVACVLEECYRGERSSWVQ